MFSVPENVVFVFIFFRHTHIAISKHLPARLPAPSSLHAISAGISPQCSASVGHRHGHSFSSEARSRDADSADVGDGRRLPCRRRLANIRAIANQDACEPSHTIKNDDACTGTGG